VSQPNKTDGFYWFSCEKFTVGVEVLNGKIHVTAPITGKFIGQPLQNLLNWMYPMKGFLYKKIGDVENDNTVR